MNFSLFPLLAKAGPATACVSIVATTLFRILLRNPVIISFFNQTRAPCSVERACAHAGTVCQHLRRSLKWRSYSCACSWPRLYWAAEYCATRATNHFIPCMIGLEIGHTGALARPYSRQASAATAVARSAARSSKYRHLWVYPSGYRFCSFERPSRPGSSDSTLCICASLYCQTWASAV